jgi:hypothetical protein
MDVVDLIENIFSEEINKSFAKELRKNLSKESIDYLYLLNEIKNEKELFLLMEKYGIIEDDLLNLKIVKLKVRDFKINSLLKEDYKK